MRLSFKTALLLLACLTIINLASATTQPTITGTAAVCGASNESACATLNSTTDPAYVEYFWEWRLNGTSTWNAPSTSPTNTTSIQLTQFKTYDFRVYANDSSGVLSQPSDYITLTMPSGNPHLDLIYAKLVEIETQNNAAIAEQAVIKSEIQALWGGMLISGILVIAWIRRKLNQLLAIEDEYD